MPIYRMAVVGDFENKIKSELECLMRGNKIDKHVPSCFDDAVVTQADVAKSSLILRDSSGMEDQDKLRLMLYKDVDIFLLVFQLNQPADGTNNSYQHVKEIWLPELKKFAPNIPILLLGLNTINRNCHEPNCDGLLNIDVIQDLNDRAVTQYITCKMEDENELNKIWHTAYQILNSSLQANHARLFGAQDQVRMQHQAPVLGHPNRQADKSICKII